jgi:hypothetical protein
VHDVALAKLLRAFAKQRVELFEVHGCGLCA